MNNNLWHHQMLDPLFDYFPSSTFNLFTAQLHHENQCRNEDISTCENVFHTKQNSSLRQTFDWHIRLHICLRLTKTMTFRNWLRKKLNLQSYTPKQHHTHTRKYNFQRFLCHFPLTIYPRTTTINPSNDAFQHGATENVLNQ